jgi:hypothetical protein
LTKADKFKSGNTVTLSCFFKTNKAESASAVYVSNEYFNTANSSFSNYKIKDFTNLMFTDGVSNDAGVAAPFSFHMDESDPLPEKVYFQFDGVRPTATSGLALVNDSSDPHNGWYWYSPTATTVAALANNYTPIINLATTRTGATATVTIEADEYNPASCTYPRVWRTGSYTINLKTDNGDEPSFTTAPQNVVFSNTEYVDNGSNGYLAMGTRSSDYWSWNYSYYSGSFTVTAPSNYDDSRITRIDMAYNQSAQAVTVNGDVSGNSTLSTKTRWNSSSTGEGNGDTTVTVTMACTGRTQYNNRNQLTSITVYYGYWE